MAAKYSDMGISIPDETIHFHTDMPIELSYKQTTTFRKCRSYDPLVMSQGFVWHQIVVVHKGKVVGINASQEIVDAIMNAVEGEELFPVAYRHGPKVDRFLVRQCKEAMDKLFDQGLRIQLKDASFLNVEVQFNVGDYKSGQISPYTKLSQALERLYTQMDRFKNVNGILNLSRFSKQQEFFQLIVDLSNRSVFQRVCDLIYRNDTTFRTINGLNLSENNITTLAPLKVFEGVEFAVIDLRRNQLTSTSRLCRELSSIKADDLFLNDNPVCQAQNYPECLRPIFKNFKRIDGIPSENFAKDFTPLAHDGNINKKGYRIDASNKSDISKFQRSEDWHGVFIPDSDKEYNKELLLDFFLLSISHNLDDVYPCYYKFAAGEHQFLVRQCFGQLKYLSEECKLEMKIGSTVLKYYLQMNIAPFKPGQVQPLDCIDKALTRCFSLMDRTLNMENFQKTPGLENIVVDLGNPRILSRVLMQAARKFQSIVELRLGNNKIVGIACARALGVMIDLKAIDLGVNWISDLGDVKVLKTLGLKSLRFDGNPLCKKYSIASDYIKAVRQYFPNLETLDNVALSKNRKVITQRNFICDVKAYGFVEYFISTYFKAMDIGERKNLQGWYHPKAIFTMCYNYMIPKISAEDQRRLSVYKKNSRNILKIRDPTQSHSTTHFGPNEIVKVLIDLPSTMHDIGAFFTDTLVFNENMTVISVHGVYSDQSAKAFKNDILLAFTRTFVIVPSDKDVGLLKQGCTYKIVNDQLNIYKPEAAQVQNAFRYIKKEKVDKTGELTAEEKEDLIIMFQEVASLKVLWCSRCLEDAKWDFQKALVRFLRYCDEKIIPDTAFL